MQYTKRLASLLVLCAALLSINVFAQRDTNYRPKFHFTPPAKWMNDPNGMFYANGVYHLFYQHNPEAAVWGPMHWGHATSKDLIRWQHQPIALYPDSLGMIFSGSAVVDSMNTSGFGKHGQIPIVAIYTYHDDQAEKAGSASFQHQALAYSLDNGITWTKYSGNPVLRSPSIRDFRDPKVIWHRHTKQWIMALAVQDHIEFYASKNLKEWHKLSEFGKTMGAHGGVWECPDLFPMEHAGRTHWVLLVNLNPGGPNKGSATQYFVGSFNGQDFQPYDTITRWLDYGPDEYAGVTWSNTGKERIFIGWMSNWSYANIVPTTTWRSAMTIPRNLALKQVQGRWYVANTPVQNLLQYADKPVDLLPSFKKGKPIMLNRNTFQLDIAASAKQDWQISLSSAANDTLLIGYDAGKQLFYLDRGKTGETAFHQDFPIKAIAPRFVQTGQTEIQLIFDQASVELFADDGLTSMTQIFFPHAPLQKLHIHQQGITAVKKMQVRYFK